MSKRVTGKNQAAVLLGRKGGKARADKLTRRRISEIARMGGLARAAKNREKVSA